MVLCWGRRENSYSSKGVSKIHLSIKVVCLSKMVQFIYLGFYVALNTVQVISRRVVGRPEETSTYSWSRFCTVNCRPTASNYQLSHLRPCQEPNPRLQRWEARVLPLFHRGPKMVQRKAVNITKLWKNLRHFLVFISRFKLDIIPLLTGSRLLQ